MADPTTKQRKLFAKMGYAMPDGSYYIRPEPDGAGDLQNAIDAVGRGEAAGDSGDAIRKHIMKRAAELKMTAKIPTTWASDGSLKQADLIDEWLAHHGVLGMRWGHHRGKAPASEDAATAGELHAKVKAGGGTHVLSNDELKKVNDRLNLEQQYGRLTSNEQHVSTGKKAAGHVLGIAGNVAKGSAQTVGQKLAVKGLEVGLKKAGVPGL